MKKLMLSLLAFAGIVNGQIIKPLPVTQAQVNASIATEATARAAGDAVNAAAITSETNNRIAADALASTDADYSAFVTRAGGVNVLTTTEHRAVANLVRNLKANGLWGKLLAFYPFVGRAESPCSKNLISSSYSLTFGKDANNLIYGWSFSQHGARGDGWGAYADTGFSPLSGWPEFASGIRSGSFGMDILQDATSPTITYYDAYTSGTGRTGASGANLWLRPTTSYFSLPGWQASGGGTSSFSSVDNVGTWVVTQSSDPSTNSVALTHPDVTRIVYKNGTAVVTQATQWYPPADGGGAYTVNGTLRFGGTGNGVRQSNAQSSDRPMSCAFFGYGFTSGDVTALTNIISQFRTDRGVVLPTQKLVLDGDSIMQGYRTIYGGLTGGVANPRGTLMFLATKQPWTNLTDANLVSYAAGGQTTANQITGYAAGPHTQAGAATHYIFNTGTNDIDAGVSNSTIQANSRTLATKAKQDGMRVIVLTILPRSDWAQGSAKDNQRLALNALRIADEGTYYDQVIDVASLFTYSMTNSTYFGDASSPYIHLNDVGQELQWTKIGNELK